LEKLRFGPLTVRTARLCLDMQNTFAESDTRAYAMAERVLPGIRERDRLLTLYCQRDSEQIENGRHLDNPCQLGGLVETRALGRIIDADQFILAPFAANVRKDLESSRCVPT
jgi:hypothetical protein